MTETIKTGLCAAALLLALLAAYVQEANWQNPPAAGAQPAPFTIVATAKP